MRFLNNKVAVALTIALIVQGGILYATASRPEIVVPMAPLSTFAPSAGSWALAQDVGIEQEVLDVLRADDTLSRVYVNPQLGASVSLFIAYFKTQRTGASPHSPKNCLPGAGWEPIATPRIVAAAVDGRQEPIHLNEYVVARGDNKSVVLYWYQSHKRIIASEYSAKFWLIADSIRYRRSDTALVKVVIPIRNNQQPAIDAGLDFIKAIFPAIERHLPA